MSKKRLPHGTNHNRRAVKPPYTPPVPTNTRELLDGYQVNFSPAMAEQGFSQRHIHECVQQFVDTLIEHEWTPRQGPRLSLAWRPP